MRHKLAVALAKDENEFEEYELKEKPLKPFKKLSPKKIEKLVLENRDHGRRLAWSFLTTWRIRLKNDDVISLVGTALCEAANRFDDSRGVAFKTFFFYHLRGILLKEVGKMINDQRVLKFVPSTSGNDSYNLDDSHSFKQLYTPVEYENPEKIVVRKETAQACFQACSELDSLEQEVIVRHFVYDESLINIADELDYCRCHISRVKTRGLAKLQKMFENSPLKEEFKNVYCLKEYKEKLKKKVSLRKTYKGGRGRRRRPMVACKAEKIRNLVEAR